MHDNRVTPQCRPAGKRLCFCLLLSGLFTWATPAVGQLLRLGPFDLTPSAGLDAIYTSNVDGVRESESELEREDYYLVLRFGLSADGDLDETWSMGTDLGVEVERHANRTDLDTDSIEDVFGELRFRNEVQSGRWAFNIEAGYEHMREVPEDTFKSGSLKTRDPVEIIDVGAEILWEPRQWAFGVGYGYDRERHDDDEFKEDDKDEQYMFFDAAYVVNSRISLVYNNERNKTDLINAEDDPTDDEWEYTHLAGVSYIVIRESDTFPPALTYTLAAEKEKRQEESGDWELVHIFDLGQGIDMNTLNVELSARYELESDEEEDDVNFVYSIEVVHDLSRTVTQALRFEREPRDTFGSTANTDSTVYQYVLEKEDLFLRDLDLAFGVSYSIDDPLGAEAGETEKTWRYDVGVAHRVDVTRKIARTLAYDYYYEDLNTETEKLDEHRVTLSYDYSF